VTWEPHRYKELNVDDSQKRFIFTLQNPHKVAARRFVLKSVTKYTTIACKGRCGPRCWDIGVHENYSTNKNSFTGYFDRSHRNHTGLSGTPFFTGPHSFTTKEIEVFEAIGSRALPSNFCSPVTERVGRTKNYRKMPQSTDLNCSLSLTDIDQLPSYPMNHRVSVIHVKQIDRHFEHRH
jgi:hypothetical protein